MSDSRSATRDLFRVYNRGFDLGDRNGYLGSVIFVFFFFFN
uniref:Uncharacterized protein n=1 Tax=Rhizophora mucronata TaxID=61149 RepID=A0A2P2M5M3_RHIMU